MSEMPRPRVSRGERCHVSAKLGPGWYYDYRVKWEMLPVIISRALHAQLAKYNQSSRLVEVAIVGKTVYPKLAIS